MSNRNRTKLVYKILAEVEWAAAAGASQFSGSAADLQDGFIHLSAADQVAATAAKHFKGQDGLVLVAFPAAVLGHALRWEPSRGGALFPHFYGPLPVAAAAWVRPLSLDADGIPLLPPELTRC